MIDGISIYGVGEQKALEIAEKAIKNGRFAAATKVIICPHTPKVPMSYLEKMKIYSTGTILNVILRKRRDMMTTGMRCQPRHRHLLHRMQMSP